MRTTPVTRPARSLGGQRLLGVERKAHDCGWQVANNYLYTYPHTIENGAGERITFLRKVRGAVGNRLEGENVVKPGVGPPMHVHHWQEEVFTVRQGRIGYQRAGEAPQFAGPGHTVAFKPGEAHRFWNAGDDDLHCTGYVEPADNVEFLLTEIFESTKRSGG